MTTYVWQNKSWPNFTWDSGIILASLAQAKKNQGFILGQSHVLNLKDEANFFIEETLTTSALHRATRGGRTE